MKHLELHRFRKTIGKVVFGLFFPNENKRLNQKHGTGKQPDLVLVSVPEGKQTQTITAIRNMTGWTVKKATAFVKAGDYPKVVTFNIDPNYEIVSLEQYISDYIVDLKDDHNIIFEIY
jgi:hypothetical protein